KRFEFFICRLELCGALMHALLQFLIQTANFALYLPAFRDVPRNHRKSAQRAACLIQRSNRLVCPECAAVFADMRGLFFMPSFTNRCFQTQSWFVLGLRLSCIEAAKILADDLLARIALHPFRALIPGQHPPVRIEHVDGVIFYSLEKQPEAFLALPQR